MNQVYDAAKTATGTSSAEHGVGRGWANLYIEGRGEFQGEIVGFDASTLVVALNSGTEVFAGRSATITLGIDETSAEGISGTTLGMVRHPDGRQCAAIDIGLVTADAVTNEANDTKAQQRRIKARVPFAAKVEAIVVASRKRGDSNYKLTAYDLSSRGMGAYCGKEIPPRSSLLLRFTIPPHRGTTMQIRAIVVHTRKLDDNKYHSGLEFERVTQAQLTQINNAIMHLSHPQG